MKFYLFLSLFMISIFYSCNKAEPNQIDQLFTIAPSTMEYTLSSDISQVSNKVTATSNFKSLSNFARPMELNSTSMDTFLFRSMMSNGAFEISDFGLELFGITIFSEGQEIINTEEEFTMDFNDFSVVVPIEGGVKKKVLYEFDIEKSISEDGNGNIVFDPVVTIREL